MTDVYAKKKLYPTDYEKMYRTNPSRREFIGNKIITFLDHKDPFIRAESCLILGRMKYKKAIPKIIELTKDSGATYRISDARFTEKVYDSAFSALKQLKGDVVINYLFKLVVEKYGKGELTTLENIGGKEVIKKANSLALTHKDDIVRQNSVWLLGKLKQYRKLEYIKDNERSKKVLTILNRFLDKNNYNLQNRKLHVTPIIFIPSDYNLNKEVEAKAKERFAKFTRLAKFYYFSELQRNTFYLVSKVKTVKGKLTAEEYCKVNKKPLNDSAHRIGKELLALDKETRMTSNKVFVVVFFGKNKKCGDKLFGGGRTFNGAPGTGGGYVELQESALFKDKPYPMLSTLIHELGHAFGLSHVDCRGESLINSPSIMGYKKSHQSNGFNLSKDPGILTKEDRWILSQNPKAIRGFPKITLDQNTIKKIEKCYLSPMSKKLGPITRVKNKGFELFFNGRLVSGPEAVFFSKQKAIEFCFYNRNRHKSLKVECRYNGKNL